MSRQFTCENCGKVFQSAWPEEEARKEAEQNFGAMSQTEQAIVCDECYRQFMSWYQANSQNQ